MSNTPLNPDALEAAARAANEEGWTCFEGSGEPGNFDTCEDCQRVDKEHANAIVSAYLAVAQPEPQANSKPKQNFEVVNSVEELDALPVDSVVLDRFDYPHHKCAQSKPDFTNLRTGHFISRGEFYFPARVLYRP